MTTVARYGILIGVLACAPEATTRVAPRPTSAPVEPKPSPAAPATKEDDVDAMKVAITERLRLREALMTKLGHGQRVWERGADGCIEHVVGLQAASKYAAELATPPPAPGAELLVIYRGFYPEVVLYTDPGAIKLAEVRDENPYFKRGTDPYALGCCRSSTHVVVAISGERADLEKMSAGKGNTWSLYFSRQACEGAQ